MSEDRRINVRGAFYNILEQAAARRYLPTAAFVTAVMSEYLRERGELGSAPVASAPTALPATPAVPNNVSIFSQPHAVSEAVRAEMAEVWGEDDD